MAKVLVDNKTRRRRKPPNRISVIISSVNAVLLLAVILVSLPLAVSRAFGYQPYTVISGSMEPAIPTGSLVFIQNKDPLGVSVGDVAAFYQDGDARNIIVHRVVANDTTSGLLTTKGDANAENDFSPVKYADCMGVVAKSIPKLGGFADAVTSKSGKTALFCIAGLAIAAQGVASIIDRKSRG